MSAIFKSIRWRLQFWHGLLLVLVLAGFGWAGFRVVARQRMADTDRELQRQAAALITTLPPFGGRFAAQTGDRSGDPPRMKMRPPPGILKIFEEQGTYFMLVSTVTGGVYYSPGCPEEIPIPEPVADPSDLRFETRESRRELAQRGGRGFLIVVGRDITNELAETHQLAWLFAGVGGGILLFGLIGGWCMVSRAMRPINRIGEAATRISDGEPDRRIDIEETESELGELAAVLNTTFDRLQAAADRQAQFTADASHELRTPLSIILSRTQTMLKRERRGDEYRDAMETCERAASRMRQLVESLLLLARFDAGTGPTKPAPVDLVQVVTEAVELMHPVAAEKSVHLQTQLVDSAPCLGDADQLTQVVINLLSNAIRHSPSGSDVRVQLEIRNDELQLSVTDNGPGIAAENHERIFERFFRVDPSRNTNDGGTGLGLAITRAITESHGGQIQVASEPGKGAKFVVHLKLTH